MPKMMNRIGSSMLYSSALRYPVPVVIAATLNSSRISSG
jgi:hypothetical protein